MSTLIAHEPVVHKPVVREPAVHEPVVREPVVREPMVTEAVPGIHRVEFEGTTVGYVLKAGAVYVSLKGSVYNTSCEVGQSLDLDSAVDRVLHA